MTTALLGEMLAASVTRLRAEEAKVKQLVDKLETDLRAVRDLSPELHPEEAKAAAQQFSDTAFDLGRALQTDVLEAASLAFHAGNTIVAEVEALARKRAEIRLQEEARARRAEEFRRSEAEREAAAARERQLCEAGDPEALQRYRDRAQAVA